MTALTTVWSWISIAAPSVSHVASAKCARLDLIVCMASVRLVDVSRMSAGTVLSTVTKAVMMATLIPLMPVPLSVYQRAVAMAMFKWDGKSVTPRAKVKIVMSIVPSLDVVMDK